MSDELDVTGGVGDLDRRDFLRRSALAGGMAAGMAWAAPVISSVGSPAFAATPTPITITPTPDGDPWSFLAATLTCTSEDGSTVIYQVKYENGAWEASPGTAPDCEPTGWENNTVPAQQRVNVRIAGSELGLVITGADTNVWTLFVPNVINYNGHSCVFLDASAKSGADAGGTLECQQQEDTAEACTVNGVMGTCYTFVRG